MMQRTTGNKSYLRTLVAVFILSVSRTSGIETRIGRSSTVGAASSAPVAPVSSEAPRQNAAATAFRTTTSSNALIDVKQHKASAINSNSPDHLRDATFSLRKGLLRGLSRKSRRRERILETENDDDVADDQIKTRPSETIEGVGVGVFLLIFFFFLCWCICLDCYHGRLFLVFDQSLPCCHKKPFSTAFCCLFWYGVIIMYLFYAPREEKTYIEGQKAEWSENYYDKYWVTFAMGFILFWLGLFWLQDFINHNLYANPNPTTRDLEQQKIEAISRSNF